VVSGGSGRIAEAAAANLGCGCSGESATVVFVRPPGVFWVHWDLAGSCSIARVGEVGCFLPWQWAPKPCADRRADREGQEEGCGWSAD